MLGDFDPYQQWLGIPPDELPPTLYRLIGANNLEQDVKVVRLAAAQQMAHIETFRTDDTAIFVQTMLEEVRAARALLLDPEKKQKYDRQLQAKLRARAASRPAVSDSSVFSDIPTRGSSVGQSDIHAAAGRSGVRGGSTTSGIQAAAAGRSGLGSAVGRSGVHGDSGKRAASKKSAVPAWIYVAVGGGVGFLGLTVALLLALMFMEPADDGPGTGSPMAAQGDGDGSETPDASVDEDARPPLEIDAIADLTAAPGQLVRIPIGMPARPRGLRYAVSGVTDASVSDTQHVLTWQTAAGDAGAEKTVTVVAAHADYQSGEVQFKIRVGEANAEVALLDLLDTRADAVAGEWKMEDGWLVSPHADNHPQLEVPYSAPDSYDLSFVAEKISGDSGLQIGLSSGSARWSVILDAPVGNGLARVDGKDYHSNITSLREKPFSGTEPTPVTCRVRPSQVQVVCGDKLIVNYLGDLGRLSEHADWKVPHPQRLSIGSQEASYRIFNAVLKPVVGASADPAYQLGHDIPGLFDYQDHYYKVYFDRLPWSVAQQRCAELGGYLACIGSDLEQSYIAAQRDQTQVWIGGTDRQQEGQWRWLDDSPFHVTHWNTGQPNNLDDGEDCLCMMSSGHWDDKPEKLELAYVCEWNEPPGAAPPIGPDVVVTPPPSELPLTQIQRSSLPPRQDLEASLVKFRSYLQTQSLDDTPARVAFVRRMIGLSRDATKNPAERYVLLHESQRLAAEKGEVELAVEAIDTMAQQFDWDPLPTKQAAVVTALKAAATPQQIRAAVQHIEQFVAEALDRDACDLAFQAAQSGYNETRTQAKKDYRRDLFELRKKAEEQYKDWDEFKKLEEKLARTPDDPEANLAVGSRYCFRRGQWEAGAELLAKSGDPGLRAVAEMELSHPQQPADRVKLADAWWAAAASQGEADRRAIFRHAGDHYESAQPNIADETLLAHIDDRLQKLADLERMPQPEPPGDDAVEDSQFDNLGLFDARSGDTHRLFLQARGGDAQSEQAVAAALQWLARHQMPDGGWNFDHLLAAGGIGNNGGTMPQARNAATGLALLAFLGAGQTHKSGSYRTQVQQGILFLGQRISRKKESAGSLHEAGGTMYSHAIATQALCEAFALTKDKNLQIPCQATLGYTIKSQHPTRGGWRYKPKESGDTSVTGWQVSALMLGSAAGLRPQPAVFALTDKFLNSQQYDGGAKYGYQSPPGSDATAAVGLLCRMHLGWERDHVAVRRGADYLGQKTPGKQAMYFDYYATQVLQNYGGEPWDNWNAALKQHLVAKQATDGPAAGSWYFDDKHTPPGGRLGCTAMAALMLESYYRYVPVYRDTRREIARQVATPIPEAPAPPEPTAPAN